MVDLHPAVRVREQALARLRRQFPGRCEADREDAVHEALCAALEHGHADSAFTVSGWAARRLLGVQVRQGRTYSARSPATSIAGHALSLGGEDDAVAPADWLDSSRVVAPTPDPEAALDLERWQGLDWATEALRLIGDARARGLSWAAIAAAAGQRSKVAPIRWASGERPVTRPDRVAVGLDDHLRRTWAEAEARARRVEEARREQERRDEAARKRAQRALATFVSRRAAIERARLAATHEAEARQRAEAEAVKHMRAEAARQRSAEARVLVPIAAAACGSMVGLAEALGVSEGTPYRWRDPRGLSPPGAEHLRRLREVAAAAGASQAHCGAP